METKKFTAKQNLTILLSFFKRQILGSFFTKSNESKESSFLKTRGNVFQRLGGSISVKEHDKMLDEEFKINN